MKKKVFPVLLAATLALSAAQALPAFADGQKVVTLGADLNEQQRNAVLKYFGVLGKNIETIYITNQDERNHLASYVPLEQIGTKTFSCALVSPTTSGGIHVKTANLNWVTSNMIASTLSTSGVVNCDVLAASPFEVSGTGALTGVMMAYEAASGETLDEEKKELANQELVTTGTLANEVGQAQATNIVNEIKIQIIEGEVVDENEVSYIVNSVVEDNTDSGLSYEDQQMLDDLAQQIAQQQYDYEDMKETLERVEENVSQMNDSVSQINDNVSEINENISGLREDVQQQAAQEPDASQNTETAEFSEETEKPESLSQDSILFGTDDTALGAGVIMDTTDEEALPAEPEQATAEDEEDNTFEFFSGDEYHDQNEETSGQDAAPGQEPLAVSDNVAQEEPDEIGIEWNEGDTSGQDVQQDVPSQEDPFAGFAEEQNPDENAFAGLNNEGQNPEEGFADQNEEDPYQEDGLADQNEEPQNPDDVPQGNAEEGNVESSAAPFEISDVRLLPNEMYGDQDVLGTSLVTVQLSAANIVSASGTLVITDEFGTEVTTIELDDPQQTQFIPMSDDMLSGLGWDEGSVLRVNVGDAFQPGGHYTIALNGSFGQAESGETAECTASSSVSAGSVGVVLHADTIDDWHAGSFVTAEAVTDNEAVTSVAISDYDPACVEPDQETVSLTEGGMFGLNLTASGKTDLTFQFCDEAGNVIDEFVLTIRIL